MALFFPKYLYTFSASEKNGTNPRKCKLFVKTTVLGEDVEASEDDENAKPATFTTTNYRFIAKAGGKIIFQSSNILQGGVENEGSAVIEDVKIDPNKEDSETTVQITVTLPNELATSSVSIEIIAKKAKTPWIRFDRVPSLGKIAYRGFIREKVLPASAIRISELIDQPLPTRSFPSWIFFSVTGAFSIGKGYGTWNIYNPESSLDEIVKNLQEEESISDSNDGDLNNTKSTDLSLYTRLQFDCTFMSLSLEIEPPGIDFTLLGLMSPPATTVPLAGVIVPSGFTTIEAQKLYYKFYPGFIYLYNMVKDSFQSYKSVFINPEDGDFETDDFDFDGEATIVDRILELNRPSPLKIDNFDSPLFFSNLSTNKPNYDSEAPLDPDRMPEVPRTTESNITAPRRELKYLVENYSAIGKPVIIRDVEFSEKLTPTEELYALALGIYKIKVKDHNEITAYLIDEDANNNPYIDDSEDTSGRTIDLSRQYTIFAKVIVPQWDRKFTDFYNRENIYDTWGVKNETSQFIRSKIYSLDKNENEKLSEIEHPIIFLVIRSAFRSSSISLPTSNKAYIFHNPDHHDNFYKQKRSETDKSPTVVINSPEKDHCIINTGVKFTNIYYETVPGYGLKTSDGSHGVDYVQDSSISIASAGISNQLQGELLSPQINFNPYKLNDLLGTSRLDKGSVIEIISNMGFDKDVGSSRYLPAYLGGGEMGLIGGNLSYIVYTVTETAPEFETPGLIAYKGRGTDKRELVTYNSPLSGTLRTFVSTRFNENLFDKAEDFGINNPTLIVKQKNPSLYNYSEEMVLALDKHRQIETSETSTDLKQDEGILKIIIEGSDETIEYFSYIKINVLSIENQKTCPCFIFYQSDDTRNVAEINSAFMPFGYADRKGNIIPKIFNLHLGENILDVRDMYNVVELRIVPVKFTSELYNINYKITNTLTFDTKSYVLIPEEKLTKKPIGHLFLKNGQHLLFFSSKTQSESPWTYVLMSSINSGTLHAQYPDLDKTVKPIQVISDFEKFITPEFEEFVAFRETDLNKYYFITLMEEAQIVKLTETLIFLIGFIYDENGSMPSSGFPLVTIPLSSKLLGLGSSTLISSTYHNNEFMLGEKGKLPFFYEEGMNNFIVKTGFSEAEKPAICILEKIKFPIIFYIYENKIRISYSNDNGYKWHEISDTITDMLLKHQLSPTEIIDNSEISPKRLSCLKNPETSSILLFITCSILGNQYMVIVKEIPYNFIRDAIYATENNQTFSQNTEPLPNSIKELLSKKPILIIGNPSGLDNSEEIQINIGNCIKKNEIYISLGEVEGDLASRLIKDETLTEQNLSSLQNVDISFDSKFGIYKVYYINNSGTRDCKVSYDNLYSWYNLKNF